MKETERILFATKTHSASNRLLFAPPCKTCPELVEGGLGGYFCPGKAVGRNFETCCFREKLEAPGGFEPPIGVLQTPALATWRRRLLSCIGWGKEENGAGEGI